jgi:hypothetical protein
MWRFLTASCIVLHFYVARHLDEIMSDNKCRAWQIFGVGKAMIVGSVHSPQECL